jgi:uncharacterized repeat protein (TIGR04138 family)
MSLNDDLAPVLIRDSRYSIDAYLFVLQALDYARRLKIERREQRNKRRLATTGRPAKSIERRRKEHVTGQELCRGARDLALRQYGLLAWPLLQSWGIHSTSDFGEIVYNMIASGDLEKTPDDARGDFDDVFDLAQALFSDFEFTSDRGGDDPS